MNKSEIIVIIIYILPSAAPVYSHSSRARSLFVGWLVVVLASLAFCYFSEKRQKWEKMIFIIVERTDGSERGEKLLFSVR